MNASSGPTRKGESIREEVRKWLNTEGFPLELRTARVLEQNGFAVTPSHHVDLGNGVSREIDALAVRSHTFMSGRVSFQLLVECKWSGRQPWILFEAPSYRPTSADILAAAITNDIGKAFLWLLGDDPEFASLSPFGCDGIYAYGGTRMPGKQDKKSRPDMVYDALQSVTAIAEHSARLRDTPRGDGSRNMTFAFPLIVVDGQLFTARLEENSYELRVKEAVHGRMRWFGARGDLCFVDIVAFGAFEELLRRYVKGIEAAKATAATIHWDLCEALRAGSADPIKYHLHGRRFGPPITFPEVLRAVVARYLDETKERGE